MSAAAYWISDQQKVTGPFTKGQITTMWDAGSITAEAQLRESESHPWNSAQDTILRWRRTRLTSIMARVGVGLSILVLCRLGLVEWHNNVENQPARLEARKALIVDWLGNHFPNKEARLLTYGPVRRELLKDKPWLDVMVSQKPSPSAASALAIYRFTFDAKDQITSAQLRP